MSIPFAASQAAATLALILTATFPARHHPNLGWQARALTAWSAGFLLIGPLGEPLGYAAHELLPLWNLEDLAGHSLQLYGAYHLAVGAADLRNRKTEALVHARTAALAAGTLLAATWTATGAFADDSNIETGALTIYWRLAPLCILPSYLYAAFAFTWALRSVRHPMLVVALVGAAAGVAGCTLRVLDIPHPAYGAWAVCGLAFLAAARQGWRAWNRQAAPPSGMAQV